MNSFAAKEAWKDEKGNIIYKISWWSRQKTTLSRKEFFESNPQEDTYINSARRSIFKFIWASVSHNRLFILGNQRIVNKIAPPEANHYFVNFHSQFGYLELLDQLGYSVDPSGLLFSDSLINQMNSIFNELERNGVITFFTKEQLKDKRIYVEKQFRKRNLEYFIRQIGAHAVKTENSYDFIIKANAIEFKKANEITPENLLLLADVGFKTAMELLITNLFYGYHVNERIWAFKRIVAYPESIKIPIFEWILRYGPTETLYAVYSYVSEKNDARFIPYAKIHANYGLLTSIVEEYEISDAMLQNLSGETTNANNSQDQSDELDEEFTQNEAGGDNEDEDRDDADSGDDEDSDDEDSDDEDRDDADSDDETEDEDRGDETEDEDRDDETEDEDRGDETEDEDRDDADSGDDDEDIGDDDEDNGDDDEDNGDDDEDSGDADEDSGDADEDCGDETENEEGEDEDFDDEDFDDDEDGPRRRIRGSGLANQFTRSKYAYGRKMRGLNPEFIYWKCAAKSAKNYLLKMGMDITPFIPKKALSILSKAPLPPIQFWNETDFQQYINMFGKYIFENPDLLPYLNFIIDSFPHDYLQRFLNEISNFKFLLYAGKKENENTLFLFAQNLLPITFNSNNPKVFAFILELFILNDSDELWESLYIEKMNVFSPSSTAKIINYRLEEKVSRFCNKMASYLKKRIENKDPIFEYLLAISQFSELPPDEILSIYEKYPFSTDQLWRIFSESISEAILDEIIKQMVKKPNLGLFLHKTPQDFLEVMMKIHPRSYPSVIQFFYHEVSDYILSLPFDSQIFEKIYSLNLLFAELAYKWLVQNNKPIPLSFVAFSFIFKESVLVDVATQYVDSHPKELNEIVIKMIDVLNDPKKMQIVSNRGQTLANRIKEMLERYTGSVDKIILKLISHRVFSDLMPKYIESVVESSVLRELIQNSSTNFTSKALKRLFSLIESEREATIPVYLNILFEYLSSEENRNNEITNKFNFYLSPQFLNRSTVFTNFLDFLGKWKIKEIDVEWILSVLSDLSKDLWKSVSNTYVMKLVFNRFEEISVFGILQMFELGDEMLSSEIISKLAQSDNGSIRKKALRIFNERIEEIKNNPEILLPLFDSPYDDLFLFASESFEQFEKPVETRIKIIEFLLSNPKEKTYKKGFYFLEKYALTDLISLKQVKRLLEHPDLAVRTKIGNRIQDLLDEYLGQLYQSKDVARTESLIKYYLRVILLAPYALRKIKSIVYELMTQFVEKKTPLSQWSIDLLKEMSQSEIIADRESALKVYSKWVLSGGEK